MSVEESTWQYLNIPFLGLNVCVVKLTGRERQVLDLIKKGLLYKQIAKELDVTCRTIEFHAAKLLKKFNVKDRYELEIILKRDEESIFLADSSKN